MQVIHVADVDRRFPRSGDRPKGRVESIHGGAVGGLTNGNVEYLHSWRLADLTSNGCPSSVGATG